MVKAMANDLPDLLVIEPPPGIKDPSELYIRYPEQFREQIEALMKAAKAVSHIRAEALTVEARQSLNVARPLLDDPDFLGTLANTLGVIGYAGDPRPAIMSYIAITSRVLRNPLNLSYISQSAAGKNAAAEAPLPLFPESAYYLVQASSPRALIYNDEIFTHRTVILTEADSLPEDGPAASAMRSLMSDGQMSYEVVEKDSNGAFHTRKIVKPGPTGLITTSVKLLGAQASTRNPTVSIPDSIEQTRLVLHAQVDRASQDIASPELGQLVALQRWLELAAERRVVIPFAHSLADLVPANAIRMRRDFAQLLTVIQTIALLHQLQRTKDSQGRIIATVDDYAEARWLLEEIFTATVNDVTPAIRETVEAVARLIAEGESVTEKQQVKELGLAKSTISYRVNRAINGGYVVNQSTQRNTPAQLVLGGPLPDGSPLPSLQDLGVCVEDPRIDSNSRTASSQPARSQIRTDNGEVGWKEWTAKSE